MVENQLQESETSNDEYKVSLLGHEVRSFSFQFYEFLRTANSHQTQPIAILLIETWLTM